MTEYLVLYGLLGIVGYGTYRSAATFDKKRKTATIVCFSLIFVLLAMRHQSMGIDLGYYVNSYVSYLQAFDNITSYPLVRLLKESYSYFEMGYVLFCKLVGTIWADRQFFLAVCAFVSLMPVAWVIAKESENPVLSCIIFLALPVFEILFSAIRQGIAVGICFCAIYFIHNKKPVHFLIAILIAFFFHKSAWIFIIAYPLYYLKLSRAVRFVSVIVILVVHLLRYQMFFVFSKLFKQNAVPDNNGAINFLLLLVLIYFICTIFYKEDDTKQNGLMNLLFVCSICQVFGNIYFTAQRIGYYFMISIVLLLPSVLENMEYRLRVIARLLIIAFFVVFGLSRIYGSTWSMMYPYHWFWEIL